MDLRGQPGTAAADLSPGSHIRGSGQLPHQGAPGVGPPAGGRADLDAISGAGPSGAGDRDGTGLCDPVRPAGGGYTLQGGAGGQRLWGVCLDQIPHAQGSGPETEAQQTETQKGIAFSILFSLGGKYILFEISGKEAKKICNRTCVVVN